MIRLSRPGDEPGLKSLWEIAFGDSPDYIDGFFSRLYRPGDAVLWADGDTVASAIYLLDAGIFRLPDGRRLKAGYAYALATLPRYRSRGLGAEVVRSALAHSAARFQLNIICPAEESLFPYYEALGYSRGISIRQGAVSPSAAPPPNGETLPVDAVQYGRLRQEVLPTDGAAQYPPAYLHYVERTLKDTGGGLFQITVAGRRGCAAVERRGDALMLRELLLPEGRFRQGLAALLAHLGTREAVFRAPAGAGADLGGETRPFALVAARPGETVSLENGYFPFVLD